MPMYFVILVATVNDIFVVRISGSYCGWREMLLAFAVDLVPGKFAETY